MTTLKVLIADSQADVRYALRTLLQLVRDLNAEVVGEVTDLNGLLQQIEARQPDLLLLDWHFPDLATLNGLFELRAKHPPMKIIVLSGEAETRSAAMSAGADAFASKLESVTPLIAAIRLMRAGHG